MIEPLSRHAAQRFSPEGVLPVHETLAEETAIALLFNGVPHVVTMATPQDLEDLASGFALSEGIVASLDELSVVEVLQRDNGLAVHLSIPAQRFEALQERRRNQVASGGCGLCGAEALDSAIRPVRCVELDTRIAVDALHAGFAALATAQSLNRDCGGLHAAAAMVGETLLGREDVGRHNAMDKTIGALARRGAVADALLVTSRGSYELVHKAAEAGVGILASVSAPTAYAVRLAETAGITLIGFARAGRLTVYSHAWRVSA